MRGSSKRKWIIIISTIVLLLSGSVISYGYYQYNQLFKRIYSPLDEEYVPPVLGMGSASNSESNKLNVTPLTEKKAIEKPKILAPFTMLLIGIDTRGEEQSRSDSMFYAVVNPQKQSLTLIPITRDIYVNVPGHGMEKMNHAMFLGGVPLLKLTLENFMGVPIQRYVTVDFEGFRRMVDEIGGVEIDVKKRMKYRDPTDGTNINLKKGLQRLDGKNALYYARYRKSDIGRDDTDEERSARQIELIKAILQQGKEKFSIFRVFSFMDIAGDHIKTNLNQKEIEQLVPIYKNFSVDQIQSTTIAGVGKRMPYGKYRLYFYVVSEKEKERIKSVINEALKAD